MDVQGQKGLKGNKGIEGEKGLMGVKGMKVRDILSHENINRLHGWCRECLE